MEAKEPKLPAVRFIALGDSGIRRGCATDQNRLYINGAITDPSVTTKIKPSVSNKTMIGASHHFLRTRRKLQNSKKIDNFPLI